MTTTDAIVDKGLKAGFNAVLAVHDYHDQPRSGVANFHGTPHYFDCIFDDSADEYSDCYRLTPLNAEAQRAAVENWESFLRWRAAFEAGQTDLSTHPALPEEAAKFEAHWNEIRTALASGKTRSIRARAEFAISAHSRPPFDATTPWQVRWRDS